MRLAPTEPICVRTSTLYRWLQRHRRDDSYFGVGYPAPKAPDCQTSCDLGEVGYGLMGYDKCVKALRWCLDVCQFEDGAHGMLERDDKWVGMAAAAVLLYEAVVRHEAISAADKAALRPRIEKSWRWLVNHTEPDTFPEDGYIRVTGKTTKKPPPVQNRTTNVYS